MAPQPLRGMVPIAHVADVARAIEFCHLLGLRNPQHLTSVDTLVWAWMLNGKAHLMPSRSARPMNPEARDVPFYLYASRRRGLS